ncbi:MAG: hypothetical protein ABW153_02135 [Sedimenticola sp.]
MSHAQQPAMTLKPHSHQPAATVNETRLNPETATHTQDRKSAVCVPEAGYDPEIDKIAILGYN